MESRNNKGEYKLRQVEIRLKVKESDPLYSMEPVKTPDKAVELLSELMKDLDRECVYVINFDNAMHPLSFHMASMGGMNYAPVDMGNLFKSALLTNASSIMMLHVHPGGGTKPGRDDIETTQKVAWAGALMGIPLRDHIIVGGGTGEHYSLRKEMAYLFDLGYLQEAAEEHKENQENQPEPKEPEPAIQQVVQEEKPPYEKKSVQMDDQEMDIAQRAPMALKLAREIEELCNYGTEEQDEHPEEEILRKKWLIGLATSISLGNTGDIINTLSEFADTSTDAAMLKQAYHLILRLKDYRIEQEPVIKENEIESNKPRTLREKLEINPAEPRFIKAVWGQGYKFEKTERSGT